VYRTQKAFITELSRQLIDMHISRKWLAGQSPVQMPAASPNMWLIYCKKLPSVSLAVNQMPER